ncbi:30S ribosomal protein S15 [archaeon]|nr:MAG: 30S ribosomal protein S15 [archaeon]
MARIYSRKKGKASSHKPPVKVMPRWLGYSKKQVEELVATLAKQNYSSATIGLILRDQYGVPDVKTITGKTITSFMRENKTYPEFPEDIMNLFHKAVDIHSHMDRNKRDKHCLKGLQNTESKIRRLLKYYGEKGMVPKDFQYDIEKIKLIVRK